MNIDGTAPDNRAETVPGVFALRELLPDTNLVDPDEQSCRVYFIYCAGFIKIGTTRALARRLGNLQIGSPFPSQGVFLLRGGRLTEGYLHFVFREHQHRGEWFRLAGSLRDFIASHAPAEAQEWLTAEEAAYRDWINQEAKRINHD